MNNNNNLTILLITKLLIKQISWGGREARKHSRAWQISAYQCLEVLLSRFKHA